MYDKVCEDRKKVAEDMKSLIQEMEKLDLEKVCEFELTLKSKTYSETIVVRMYDSLSFRGSSSGHFKNMLLLFVQFKRTNMPIIVLTVKFTPIIID